MSEKITTLNDPKRTSRTRQRSGAHPDQCQTAMGGRPRVCHLECGGHQTVMVNGEETAGHLTGDCADVAGPAAQTRIVSVARIRLDLQIQGRAGDALNARERLSAAKIRLGVAMMLGASTCHAAAPPRNVPRKLDGARGDKSGQTFVPSGIFTSS